MATHEAQSKSSLIRERDNDEDPDNHQQPSKIQRLESPDTDTVQTTKIINLIDDCLMKIFGHLELECLLSVAVANEWLRPAANEVYKRKFGTKRVEIGKCDVYQPNTHSNASDDIVRFLDDHAFDEWFKSDQKSDLFNNYMLIISGLRTSLQYLRCFGPSIDHLTIDYNNKSKSKRYEYVLQYINEYCADNLADISFDLMPNVAIKREQFRNVFSNVKTVCFRQCSLACQLPSAVECFPNVQNLYLVHNEHCKTSKMIQAPFHHLENVHIFGLKEIQSSKIVANLLQMAYPLKKLVITTIGALIPAGTLFDWIKYNRSLCKLGVYFDVSNIDDDEDEDETEEEGDVDDEGKCKGENLIINTTMPVESEEVQQLITNHPALIDLNLPSYLFGVEDAIQMVQELHSSKNICLKIKRTDYTYFVNQLAVAWKTKDHSNTPDSKYVMVELNR